MLGHDRLCLAQDSMFDIHFFEDSLNDQVIGASTERSFLQPRWRSDSRCITGWFRLGRGPKLPERRAST